MRAAIFQKSRDAVDHTNFERDRASRSWKKSLEVVRHKHGFTRTRRRPISKNVMAASRRDFDGSSGGFHPFNVAKIGATPNVRDTASNRRCQNPRALEVADQGR